MLREMWIQCFVQNVTSLITDHHCVVLIPDNVNVDCFSCNDDKRRKAFWNIADFLHLNELFSKLKFTKCGKIVRCLY